MSILPYLHSITNRARLCLTLCALCVFPAATAQTTAPASMPAAAVIPLGDFFKRPQFTQMLPSPNGRYLATTSPMHGRLNLVVIDLKDRKGVALTNFDDIDVGRIGWVGNDFLLFSAIQLGAPTGQDLPRAGGLFSVAMDGSGVTRLVKTASQLGRTGLVGSGFVAMRPVAQVPGSPEEMVMEALLATDDSFDLYRVNIRSGKYRILTQGRPSDHIGRWLVDSKQVPRVVIAAVSDSSTEVKVLYRNDADSPWYELTRFDTTRPPAMVPLAFDTDDKTLIVASNEGRKNFAIYRYDPQAKKLGELIAQHPRYDLGAGPQGESLGSLIRHPRTREVLGFELNGDKRQVVWSSPQMAKIQATVDASLRGMTNVLQFTGLEGKRYVVDSYSDAAPGRFFIFDEDKNNLEEIGPTRPWLDNKLANVRPFVLKTRDGLEIPSYYILPKWHQPGQKLPTVVHIHGGPMARDVVDGGRFGSSFGVREGQLLASRGYAVVLPNFRITPEIGSDIYYAGMGAYGFQMSDDHEDAANWAVSQGFSDPNKICISGASYGGYAALHALTRPSNPFACAISGLPVTDNKFQRSEADYADSKAAVEYWRKVLGVTGWDDPKVRQTSPVFSADKIKVPVFMYIGEEDVRTPPKQAYRMADALKQAGNPVKDFFVGKGEGHGYGVEATNIRLYEQMLKFLSETIGK